MGKTKILVIVLVAVVVLCSGVTVFTLVRNNGGTQTTTTAPATSAPTKLTAPTVVLTNDTATWSADACAEKFEISVDGTLSYIENSVTSKQLVAGQSFKIRAIGDGIQYTNSDWSNTVTYTASAITTYTVTWKNGDTVLETDVNVAYGEIPSYNGATPTKESTAQHMYVFSGWSPQVSAVTGNVTYQAQFSEVSRVYTITWKNGDTVLETDENVAFGATPVYNGPTPTKGQGYIFSGWSPAIASATADITYYAQFTDEGNKHIVIFYDEDGETELGRTLVENGETAIYPNVLPTKAPSAQSFFTFEKWVTEKGGTTEAVFTNITENKNVYAK